MKYLPKKNNNISLSKLYNVKETEFFVLLLLVKNYT